MGEIAAVSSVVTGGDGSLFYLFSMMKDDVCVARVTASMPLSRLSIEQYVLVRSASRQPPM